MVLTRVQQAGSNVGHSLFGAATTLFSTRIVVPSRSQADAEAVIQRYQALRAYRANNRLYDELRLMLTEANLPDKVIAGFRNPTNAVVEFYCATVWPGANLREALPIESQSRVSSDGDAQAEKERQERLHEAAYQVMLWSNWATKKQRYIRDLATLGDQFLKVVSKSDARDKVQRVFFRLIRPEDFTDFDVDERGFLTYVRMDIPRSERQTDGSLREYVHVEVWDKRLGTYRVWEVPKERAHRGTDDLGTPLRSAAIADLTGGDFIPFVHTKFIEDDEGRGMAAIEPALDKIDELNAMVTRLHRRLYLYGTAQEQMVSGVMDPDGLPMAPPADADGDDVVLVADGDIMKIPSGWRLYPRNQGVDFEAQAQAIKDHMDHLRQTDLPELGWGQIGDTTREMAGIALRIMLTAPLAKALEVRGNAEAGLIRATQMAMTIAQNGGIPQFAKERIGSWNQDGSDFEFWFKDRAVIPLTEEEEAQIEKTRAEAAEKKALVGWSNDQIQREFGLSSEEIETMKDELPAERAAGALLDAALRRGQ